MQLRPHVANFDLSSENSKGITNNLDISLFERLCTSSAKKIPSTQLTVQRRMRPSIADLVRLPLYPGLLDHKDVHSYPKVMGMADNLYWFDHSNWEDGQNESDMKEMSHSNGFEVEMATQLVAHLHKQGCYKSGDIAIITPYLGQLRKLRLSLGKHFSVEISDRDEEDLVNFLEPTIEPTVEPEPAAVPLKMERKPLSDSIRIATVMSPWLWW
jgi:superfamily I DNA and/or RNA helicase